MEKLQALDEYVYKNQKKLRYGITTGSCAAAATYAAASRLLCKSHMDSAQIKTPKGVLLKVPVFFVFADETSAEYMVVKDSGDDPDVTNGIKVHVRVKLLDENDTVSKDCFYSGTEPEIFLDGGIGVGRVTKDGLEQRVNQAAINTVPRQMIFDAATMAADEAQYTGRLLITVSMPEGEALAEKTFNPKLGIRGGLSVLGTSGILEPMSERAIVDTIETEIRQLKNTGVDRLLVTPGNYGQGYVSRYLGLELSDSVKCSNYIGETIDLAISYGMRTFLLVGNAGKLCKLAAGVMNTHSRTADCRGEIFGVHAALCGADRELVAAIMDCINTDRMIELLAEHGLKNEVLDSIINKIDEKVAHRIGGAMDYAVVLFSEKYGWLGSTKNADEIIKKFAGA